MAWGPWNLVRLLIPIFRIRCPNCGVKTEEIPCLPAGKSYTKRLADSVALACREIRSIKSIAKSFSLSWHTVKSINKEYLNKELNPPKFEYVKHLSIDEFSIKKRHIYGTVFMDLDKKKVLWICLNRDKASIVNVFKNIFGKKVCEQIQAVSMDMWDPYESAIKECLPNAVVTWDLFHIIKIYNKDVVDRVRIDESKKLLSRGINILKNSKFLLLKNLGVLRPNEHSKLSEILALNKSIFKVHLMRDSLRHLWHYNYEGAAKKWFKNWYYKAMMSKVEPLKKFAKMIKRRLHGVLSHCTTKLNNGTIEGMMNKIKVIKRISFGYRDYEYFFLKVRGHFCGIGPQ